MRYAIVSDIHANMQAWKAVLADACARRADTVICLGDVVGYGPKPAEVLESVRSITNNFVMGNHDAAAVGMMDYSIFNDHARQAIEWTMVELDNEAKGFLSSVPLAIEAGEILFVHAEIAEPGRFGYIDNVDVAKQNFEGKEHLVTFVGHTHLPKIFQRSKRGRVTELPDQDMILDPEKRYIVNVGSVGEPRNPEDLRACYLIYDDQARSVEFCRVEFDIPAYRMDLESTSLALRPYFLRVYEQVVEGREVVVSQGGSLVDMKVDRNSASLVDLGKVSNVVQYSNEGALLDSARPSKAPSVILGAMVALVLVGGLIVWATQSGDKDKTADPGIARIEGESEKKPRDRKIGTGSQGSLAGTPTKEEDIKPENGGSTTTENVTNPAVVAVEKTEPKPKPEPAEPKPKPEPADPEPVAKSNPYEEAWWRMDGDEKEGILGDVNGKVNLYPMAEGKKMKAIAPDPVPLNQKRNKGAIQSGIWQEDIASELFLMSPKHSFTVEGWFLTEPLKRPVFLLGTRTGGADDRRGWHLDLRPGGLGTRMGKITFFFDNGEDRSVAMAEEVMVDDLRPHHFAVVWDHDVSGASGEMQVYLNGERVAAKRVGHSALLKNQANPFRVGAEGNPERMALDELRFSRRALEPHQFLSKKAVTGVTISKANAKDKDSWSVAENWEGGKLPGREDNVVIGRGLTVQAEKKPPLPYNGALVLQEKAKLTLWGDKARSALPKMSHPLVMYEGSRVVLRTGEVEFGPIELVETAEIRGGESTHGHNAKRRFRGKISGSGMLLLNGVNKNVFYFHAPNTYTGGTRAFSRANQGYRISVKSNGAFGSGDVTIEEFVSLKLGREMGEDGDAIADDAVLMLNGREGTEHSKLRLEVNETVGGFMIDGKDQGEGVFTKETHPQIGGDGKLTVIKRK
ncbi:MAG: metallophosphoesterase family protein [Akkermansiaceae bacterium]